MKNKKSEITSGHQEIKNAVLEEIKRTIEQRYQNTSVSLREGKAVKTKIWTYEAGSVGAEDLVEKLVRVNKDTLDLLTKNGFIMYPVIKPATKSEADIQ